MCRPDRKRKCDRCLLRHWHHGLIAAKKAGRVTGVELNKDAVKDARINAKENKSSNVRFCEGDAGEYMEAMAASGQTAQVVFMDPPRAGSNRNF